MCITILKNDTSCQYMGFGQTKDELQKEEGGNEKMGELFVSPAYQVRRVPIEKIRAKFL